MIITLIILTAIVVGGVAFLGYQGYKGLHASKRENRKEITSESNSGSAITADSSGDIADLTPDDADTAYILIGDSRFVGMDLVCQINGTENRFVVAKQGQGLDWFLKEGLPQAEQVEASNPQYTKWKWIICLGVNDLWDAEKYIDEYTTLKNEHDITLVSVGPVGDEAKVTNEDIDAFNSAISTFCTGNGIRFIDYNSTLKAEGFDTKDGLHYTSDTYKKIFDIIDTQMRYHK